MSTSHVIHNARDRSTGVRYQPYADPSPPVSSLLTDEREVGRYLSTAEKMPLGVRGSQEATSAYLAARRAARIGAHAVYGQDNEQLRAEMLSLLPGALTSGLTHAQLAAGVSGAYLHPPLVPRAPVKPKDASSVDALGRSLEQYNHSPLADKDLSRDEAAASALLVSRLVARRQLTLGGFALGTEESASPSARADDAALLAEAIEGVAAARIDLLSHGVRSSDSALRADNNTESGNENASVVSFVDLTDAAKAAAVLASSQADEDTVRAQVATARAALTAAKATVATNKLASENAEVARLAEVAKNEALQVAANDEASKLNKTMTRMQRLQEELRAARVTNDADSVTRLVAEQTLLSARFQEIINNSAKLQTDLTASDAKLKTAFAASGAASLVAFKAESAEGKATRDLGSSALRLVLAKDASRSLQVANTELAAGRVPFGARFSAVVKASEALKSGDFRALASGLSLDLPEDDQASGEALVGSVLIDILRAELGSTKFLSKRTTGSSNVKHTSSAIASAQRTLVGDDIAQLKRLAGSVVVPFARRSDFVLEGVPGDYVGTGDLLSATSRALLGAI